MPTARLTALDRYGRPLGVARPLLRGGWSVTVPLPDPGLEWAFTEIPWRVHNAAEARALLRACGAATVTDHDDAGQRRPVPDREG